jgi:hypothetical protein
MSGRANDQHSNHKDRHARPALDPAVYFNSLAAFSISAATGFG